MQQCPHVSSKPESLNQCPPSVTDKPRSISSVLNPLGLKPDSKYILNLEEQKTARTRKVPGMSIALTARVEIGDAKPQ